MYAKHLVPLILLLTAVFLLILAGTGKCGEFMGEAKISECGNANYAMLMALEDVNNKLKAAGCEKAEPTHLFFLFKEDKVRVWFVCTKYKLTKIKK